MVAESTGVALEELGGSPLPELASELAAWGAASDEALANFEQGLAESEETSCTR